MNTKPNPSHSNQNTAQRYQNPSQVQQSPQQNPPYSYQNPSQAQHSPQQNPLYSYQNPSQAQHSPQQNPPYSYQNPSQAQHSPQQNPPYSYQNPPQAQHSPQQNPPYSYQNPSQAQHSPQQNPPYSYQNPPHSPSYNIYQNPPFTFQNPAYAYQNPTFSYQNAPYTYQNPQYTYTHQNPQYTHQNLPYTPPNPPYTPLNPPHAHQNVPHAHENPPQEHANPPPPPPSPPRKPVDRKKVCKWILDLQKPESREKAILKLSKNQRDIQDLAPMLYFSFGTLTILLHEVINIYGAINPPTLTCRQSNRVCNTLALMQCMASHPDTRGQFLETRIPLFLYPFIHTSAKTRAFEYLRLTSLAVIGALLKTGDKEVVTFMLTTEIVPLCLRIMDAGYELCKIVATFILQKIVANDDGLFYVCKTYDRFSNVSMILGKMIFSMTKKPSARLLKYIVECYFRLCDDPRGREALKQSLPVELRDATFSVLQDVLLKERISELIKKVDDPEPATTPYEQEMFK